MNAKHLWSVMNGLIRLVTIFLLIYFLSSCTAPPKPVTQDGPPPFPVNLSKIHSAVPRYVPRSKYGNCTYRVDGKRYHILKTAEGYNQRGIASWYGTKFNGKLTSTHQPYNMLAMTAASKVLPIPTYARVTNLKNGRQVIVKVNDRGPFAPNRIIDLSWAAAAKLGFANRGTALVQVTAIDTRHPEPTPVHRLPHPTLYLQAAAFQGLSNAKHLRVRLAKLTHDPVIISPDYSQHPTMYRVQIGPLAGGVQESDHLHYLLFSRGFGDAMSVVR